MGIHLRGLQPIDNIFSKPYVQVLHLKKIKMGLVLMD
jgi:hypothetical protein